MNFHDEILLSIFMIKNSFLWIFMIKIHKYEVLTIIKIERNISFTFLFSTYYINR
jgi:hypothetical protein